MSGAVAGVSGGGAENGGTTVPPAITAPGTETGSEASTTPATTARPFSSTAPQTTVTPASENITEGLDSYLESVFGQQTQAAGEDGSNQSAVTYGTVPIDRGLDVMIRVDNESSITSVAETVDEVGRVEYVFADAQLISAVVPANEITTVSRESSVQTVGFEPESKRTAGTASTAATGAAATSTAISGDSWGTRAVDAHHVHDAGLRGEGVTVAVLDTGIADVAGLQSKVVDQEDFDGNGPVGGDDPIDHTGHGSNVAGIVAASETTVRLPGGGDTKRINGVAPGVDLLNGKIGQFRDTMEQSGQATPVGGSASVDLTTQQSETVNVHIPEGGRYIHLKAAWSDSNDDVDITLLDNGRAVRSLRDSNGVFRRIEERRTPSSVVLEANGSGSFDEDDITGIRVERNGTVGRGPDAVSLELSVYGAGSADVGDQTAAIYWASNTRDLPLCNPPLGYCGGIPDPAQTADIISLSYSTVTGPLSPVDEAMDAAVDNGTVFITSAGNGYQNDKVINDAKQKTNIITVGSMNENGDRSYFSEIGDAQNGIYKPDVVAPGSNIPSAGPPDRIPEVPESNNGTMMSGTSQATPHVSGVAALYMQAYYRTHGEMPTPEQVRAALIEGSIQPPGFGQSSYDDRPISLTFDDETGTGIVNAYNTYLTFTYAGESADPLIGSADRESTITVSTPSVMPTGRLSSRGSGPFLGGTLYYQDQGDDFEFSVDGTDGNSYGPINTVNTTASGSSTYTYRLDATTFAGAIDRSEEWAVGTLYPPTEQTVDGQQVNGYAFSGPLTLDPNESAAYAVPNGRSLPSGRFIARDGGIRAIAYYNSTQGDINVSASVPGGRVSASSSMNVTEYETEQVLTREPSDTGKVIFSADGTAGAVDLSHASNYPLVALPSEASVTNGDMNAGNASNPDPVEFDVTVENANLPYDPSASGGIDASQFTVTVGSKQVPSDRLTLSRVGARPGKYHLKLTPPKQPATGAYDLTVGVTDSKYGVSHTATTTKQRAISYTGTGTGGSTSASVLIVDDSGSMSGTPIRNAKQAAKQYVALLSDSDRAAISRYDGSASTPYGLSLVEGNRSAMRTSIDSFDAGGLTDIGEGLNVGYTEITKANDSTPKAAILLSDGQHNGQVSPRVVADQYANADIPVYTIALGSGADETLLTEIATETGGEFKATPTSRNLSDIYADLGQTVTGTSTIASTSGSVGTNSQITQTVTIDDSTSTAKFRTQLRSGLSGSSAGSASDGEAEATTTATPSVRLQFPNGTMVSMSQTQSGYEADPSNVEYTKIGDTHIYRVDEPDLGEWSTTIENSESQSKEYSLRVTGSTSATLSLNTGSPNYVNGSVTTLTAQFVNQSGGISDASVTATVNAPDGSTNQVTLTEESTGVYEGTIANTDTGETSVTVEAARANIIRQRSTSWRVVDASTVLQTGSANTTTPSGAEGGTVVAGVDLTLPSGSSSLTTASATDQAQTDTDEDGNSAFESAVREVAASEPGTFNESAVDPAVLQAAEVVRNQSDESGSVDTVSQASGGSGKRIYLQAGELTGPGGATIPASEASVSTSVVTLTRGQTRTVTVSVSTSDDVRPGIYTGTLDASVDGTILTDEIKVNVTEATAATHRARISSSTQEWQKVGSAGKDHYETQIADHLTQLYFDTDSGAGTNSQQSVAPRSADTPSVEADE